MTTPKRQIRIRGPFVRVETDAPALRVGQSSGRLYGYSLGTECDLIYVPYDEDHLVNGTFRISADNEGLIGTGNAVRLSKISEIDVLLEAPELRSSEIDLEHLRGSEIEAKESGWFRKAVLIAIAFTRNFDRVEFVRLLEKADRSISPKDKGSTMQDVARYLVHCLRPYLHTQSEGEGNRVYKPDFLARITQDCFLGTEREFVVFECKNTWRKPPKARRPSGVWRPLDGKAVNQLILYLNRLQSRDARWGIAITRMAQTEPAWKIQMAEYEQYGRFVVVIDREDLGRIAEGANFVEILCKKQQGIMEKRANLR